MAPPSRKSRYGGAGTVSMPYALPNMNVFKSFLKLIKEAQFRMSVGREFQIVGPVTSKLRGPKRIVFDRGMIRSPRVADRCPRRPATLAVDFNISERYGGADPCMQLNTMVHSLNSILC